MTYADLRASTSLFSLILRSLQQVFVIRFIFDCNLSYNAQFASVVTFKLMHMYLKTTFCVKEAFWKRSNSGLTVSHFESTDLWLPIFTDAAAVAATLKSQFSIISACSCCQTIAHLSIKGLGAEWLLVPRLAGSIYDPQWNDYLVLVDSFRNRNNISGLFSALLKHKISDNRDSQRPVLIRLPCTVLFAKEGDFRAELSSEGREVWAEPCFKFICISADMAYRLPQRSMKNTIHRAR